MNVLWALSHQTLVLSDPPVLRSAGFNVVCEEPEFTVLRDADVWGYPSEFSPNGGIHPELARLRLWPRGGICSKREMELVNRSFDAIMVSRLDIANTLTQWFEGVVLWRHLGNVPALNSCKYHDSSVHESIICVPIFESLLATTNAAQESLLWSLIPSQGFQYEVRHSFPTRIGLFVGGLRGELVRELVGELKTLIPKCVQIVILGGNQADSWEQAQDVVSHPRLNSQDFIRVLKGLDFLVYPFDNPHHSHYLPYEAVQAGIPLLTTENTPFGLEAKKVLRHSDWRDCGLFPNISELLIGAGNSLESRSYLNFPSRQREILAPRSEDSIRKQALQLRTLLSSFTGAPSIASPVARQQCAEAGSSSSVKVLRELASGQRRDARLRPSDLVTPTNLDGTIPVNDLHETLWIERAHPDLVIRLGQPPKLRQRVSMVVEVRTSAMADFPGCLQSYHEQNFRDVPLTASGLGERNMTNVFIASAHVEGGQSLRLVIRPSQAQTTFAIYEIYVGTGNTPRALRVTILLFMSVLIQRTRKVVRWCLR